MNFIIDTNILIEIENNNQQVINKLTELKDSSAELYITFFTFCEFYYGAINKSEKNKTKVIERLNKYLLLNTTQSTAIIFSETLNSLKKKGKTIPHFDILIAAMAIENNMSLITADNHFNEIPNLKKMILFSN